MKLELEFLSFFLLIFIKKSFSIKIDFINFKKIHLKKKTFTEWRDQGVKLKSKSYDFE